MSTAPRHEIVLGNCLDVLKRLPDASCDSLVTDPPYGLSAPPDIAEVMRHWLAGDRYEHGAAGFMGKDWDSFVPGPEYWREVYRVLKPGAHGLVFAGSRTFDLMSIALRFAGFEIRDTLCYMHGQGFPKSLDVSKAIDKAAGAEREITREEIEPLRPSSVISFDQRSSSRERRDIAATDAAKQWSGWGTALKPAYEPIILVRKPFDGTVAKNVLAHGTGALNIDGCRIGYASDKDQAAAIPQGRATAKSGALAGGVQNENDRKDFKADNTKGRWPANVIFSHNEGSDEQSALRSVGTDREGPGGAEVSPHNEGCRLVGKRKIKSHNPDNKTIEGDDTTIAAYGDYAKRSTVGHADADGNEEIDAYECELDCPVRLLDEQSGDRPGMPRTTKRTGASPKGYGIGVAPDDASMSPGYGDSGGASRFFYCAKTSKRERNEGCEQLYWKRTDDGFIYVDKAVWDTLDPKDRAQGNIHPTVKPRELMRWLCRLVTPPNGIVLDPFAGSGSTICAAILEGFRAYGVELEAVSHSIALWRVHAADAAALRAEAQP